MDHRPEHRQPALFKPCARGRF